jgi:hypothetical protein
MQRVATHAICPLALKAYKYNELQMTFTTQKLSYNASCKTLFFLIMKPCQSLCGFGSFVKAKLLWNVFDTLKS